MEWLVCGEVGGFITGEQQQSDGGWLHTQGSGRDQEQDSTLSKSSISRNIGVRVTGQLLQWQVPRQAPAWNYTGESKEKRCCLDLPRDQRQHRITPVNPKKSTSPGLGQTRQSPVSEYHVKAVLEFVKK